MKSWAYCSSEKLIERISLVALDTIGEIMGAQRPDEQKIASIEGVRALCEYLIDQIRSDEAADKAAEEKAHDEG